MAPERLQKILASYGVASRRKAEELILGDRVAVNGQIANTLGVKADPICDRITVDGKPINHKAKPQFAYLLLHKPRGFICSRHDPQGRATIQDLLPPAHQHLYSVGRLDYDSSGALLLTNDGTWANQLMHPRHHVTKVYRVWVQGQPSTIDLQRWREGVELDQKLTLPAAVEVLATLPQRTYLKIGLREGRNRQIRRLAAMLGHPVLELHREAIANIELADLPLGQYRCLTEAELQTIHRQLTT